MAAPDGRMVELVASQPDCLNGLVDSVAQQVACHRWPVEAGREASIAELLEVDYEYRIKAAAGALRRIAPKRQDPWQAGWLPVLHSYRGSWHYTAMFSTTPRAHRLGMTNDWVMLYYYGYHGDYQCTVITSRFGPLTGNRIVRGREAECVSYYAQHASAVRENSG